MSNNKIYFKKPILIGLSLVFLISLISILANLYTLQKKKKYSEVINISGRQRMLSQKITLELYSYLSTQNLQNKQHLKNNLNLFNQTFKDLSEKEIATSKNYPLSSKINDLYSKKGGLKESHERFNSKILSYLKQKKLDNKSFSKFKDFTREILLKKLNEIVDQYERESRDFDKHLTNLLIGSTITLFLLLIILYLKIFSPMLNKIEEAYRLISKRKEEAEESTKIISYYLSHMSHEIRAPLNGISAVSYLLEESCSNEEDQELIDTINNASTNIAQIIDSVLDLARLENGKLKLNLEVTDIKKDLDYLINISTPLANKKSLGLFKYFDSNLPSHFVTDSLRLKQIILNVLNNAIKYTHSGKIEFNVIYDEKYLIIDIIDTGVGIPEDKIDSIFEGFTRMTDPYSINQQGTGLGLPIAKKLMTAFNGEIKVASTLNVGTTFKLKIPMDKA